ncbi:MAG: protein-L-isoaspartate(D-aspartate) O-methyltransferase [Planctomycetaceae bacterium]|nr:protein-L-isoaspartate(D-aspartate) O-methyltransferase [Planctomycetaceae bacterium]
MHDTIERRARMVESQIVARGIHDAAVLRAMRSVPRDVFTPYQFAGRAYGDSALPIEEGQTISQPYIVALMAETLELKETDRVLEVGVGSGYAAAVLSRIAGEVYAIDRHPTLVQLARQRFIELGYENVWVKTGDGAHGWPEHAPFDAISVAAAATSIPQSLLDQLAIGGRLVIPIGFPGAVQKLVLITRSQEHHYDREELADVRFVPLV